MGTHKEQSNSKQKIGGVLGYHGLGEWWLTTFSEQEREYIVKTYQPFSVSVSVQSDETGHSVSFEEIPTSKDFLTSDNIDYPTETAFKFLSGLSAWFKKKKDGSIAFRIIEKAEEKAEELLSRNILDIHFFYHTKIVIYYRHRNIEPTALEKAIEACKNQIAIAPEAKKGFLEDYKSYLGEYNNKPLPEHTGFKQLAIIEEKRNNYQEAIAISVEALKQGWAGDWEKRIKRLSVAVKSSYPETDGFICP